MKLSIHEVTHQLRCALDGKAPITCVDPDRTWDKAFCGDVRFNVGDWQITFFNDCYELDYVDYASAPGGRDGSFADWIAEDDEGDQAIFCPLDLLTSYERDRLEQMLEQAR